MPSLLSWQLGWRRATGVSGLIVVILAGCGDDKNQLMAPHQPEVIDETADRDPNSAIAAVFTAQTAAAHSVRIEISGDPDGTRVTRDVPIVEDVAQVPILGLFPDTDYQLRAIAVSDAGLEAVGSWIPFRSGALPASIVSFEITTSSDIQPGLTLLSPRRYTGAPHPAVIIDRNGRVVWYHEVGGGLGDFQLQPNGHLTASYSSSAFQEWDALGNVVGQWAASGCDSTDSHELRLLGTGEGLLLGLRSRVFDLTRFDGPADATVVGSVLQRIGADGNVAFEWNAFDHYALEDADDFVWQSPGLGTSYDFTHSNAIEILPDGDYLLSTRHLSEITRIDSTTGEVRWRMGKGKGNQFTFVNDPKGGFWNMHGVRRLPNGHLILIDNGNGHMPPSSRAVEYVIDEEAMTATLVWSYEPGTASCCMGFAQRLANGNTLVTLGNDFRVSEVSPSGDVVWEARLPMNGAGFFGIYRAFRISSLNDLK